METTSTYALRSNYDGVIAPERFTAAEAEAAMRLDPWLADALGAVTLVKVTA